MLNGGGDKGLAEAAKYITESQNNLKFRNGDKIEMSPENIIKTNGYLQIPYNAVWKYGLKQNPGW